MFAFVRCAQLQQTLSKRSSAKSVTPHERSTSSYGLRPKMPPFFSHEQTHLRKTTRFSVRSQHFFVFRVFCPANRTRLPCPDFRQQTRCSCVDSVLPVPGVKPLHPHSDVLVGIHSSMTVILATFPPENDHGATLSRNRTSHVPNDMTQNPLSQALGMTHH